MCGTVKHPPLKCSELVYCMCECLEVMRRKTKF